MAAIVIDIIAPNRPSYQSVKQSGHHIIPYPASLESLFNQTIGVIMNSLHSSLK